MRYTFILFAVFILMSSCFKEDKRVPSITLYDEIGLVDMGSEPGKDYLDQLYFDFSSNKVVKKNGKYDWDLSFKCGNTPNLFVNSAVTMSVASTGSYDFNRDYNTADYDFKNERAEKFYTHGWLSKDFNAENTPQGEVFIINLGTNLSSRPRGYKLLQILSWSNGIYRLQISDMDHSNLQEFEINADNNTYNYVFCSFDSPSEVLELEPPKEEWDLFFTKYMERLYDGSDTLNYSVTGSLLNPYLTEAVYYNETVDSGAVVKDYNSLSLQDLNENHLSRKTDVIGYDWKYYDLEGGKYIIYDNMLYFLRDVDGVTYKIHFTGFLGNDGRRGVISFAYLPL